MRNDDNRRQLCWTVTVIVTCFICYGMNYFTRNHLYVTTPAFKYYLDPDNDDNAQKWLGIIYTFGWVGFLCSKLFVSIFIDASLKSGVKPLAFGLIMVPVLVSIMAMINIDDPNKQTLRIWICIIIWTLIRAALAPQWAGVIRIMTNWLHYKQYGRVMSFMSLSYLIGDFITRLIYGYILTFDTFDENWRNVSYFGSVMTFIAVIPLLILVRDYPTQKGLESPAENPDNAYSDVKHADRDKYVQVELCETETTDNDENNHLVSNNKKDESEETAVPISENVSENKSSICLLLKPLIASPMLYFQILLNFELSFLREFFNMSSAAYLQSIGASSSKAALISSLFPLMGAISAPIHGIWLDRMLKNNRNILRYLLFPIQAVMIAVSVIIFWKHDVDIDLGVATLLLLICGFGILGCYTMIYVLGMDLGGQTSPTLVNGITDCFGMIGALIVAFIFGFGGWNYMFGVMTIMSIILVVTTICLLCYLKCYKS